MVDVKASSVLEVGSGSAGAQFVYSRALLFEAQCWKYESSPSLSAKESHDCPEEPGWHGSNNAIHLTFFAIPWT